MNLREKPFNLNDEGIKWVQDTLCGMTQDEKIGQLFCMVAYTDDEDFLKKMQNDIRPGGLMCRPMPLTETVASVNLLQKSAKIPMLIAANLESGGNGAVAEATKIGSPLQVAATDDMGMAAKLGTACGEVGAAAGINWTFAPIIDLDLISETPSPIPALLALKWKPLGIWAWHILMLCRIRVLRLLPSISQAMA